MLPFAAIGKEGFHAISQTKPSGSAKNPWRPKKTSCASLSIVAPASAASASTVSTCSSSATLCASEKRGNSPDSTSSTSTPASAANDALGNRTIATPPVLKNATSSPPISDLGHPRACYELGRKPHRNAD